MKKESITEQVRSAILEKIQTGELNPDDQLPTVRQLAAQLRVNFNTVARAYRLLASAGWIITQQGRGTYVLPPSMSGGVLIAQDREEILVLLEEKLTADSKKLDMPIDQVLAELIIRRLPKSPIPALLPRRKQRQIKKVRRAYTTTPTSAPSAPNRKLVRTIKKNTMRR